MSFQTLVEQVEAKRLLGAALAEGPAHAYLFHGPAGVGKRLAARAFAAALLGDEGDRVERGAHPDLYVLEPLGDMIRIDEARELRRDLHMRPFEADRRVYLIFGAHLLNAEAADALLKDLEEPPPYAVVVLVADELGPLPETIRSRCQLVPFRRLSERAVREEVDRLAPGLRARAGNGGRPRRGRAARSGRAGCSMPTRPVAARSCSRSPGRSTRIRRSSRPPRRRSCSLSPRSKPRRPARGRAGAGGRELPEREADQYVKRAERGAERDETLLALEELGAWYRDLVVVAAGAERAVVHYDRLAELTEDAGAERMVGAERAAEAVRETWRSFEEFNVSPALALEALFVTLRRELASAVAPTV